MKTNTFCPFIKGECRSDCTFNRAIFAPLNNGYHTKCEIMAFLSLQNEADLESIIAKLSKLFVKDE